MQKTQRRCNRRIMQQVFSEYRLFQDEKKAASHLKRCLTCGVFPSECLRNRLKVELFLPINYRDCIRGGSCAASNENSAFFLVSHACNPGKIATLTNTLCSMPETFKFIAIWLISSVRSFSASMSSATTAFHISTMNHIFFFSHFSGFVEWFLLFYLFHIELIAIETSAEHLVGLTLHHAEYARYL